MNRSRMMVFALLAVAMSVVVAFVAYRVLKHRLAPPDETVQIVVAADKLQIGARVTDTMLRTASWPRGVQLDGSFSDPAEVVGRGVLVPMQPNEPVLESKLAPKEAGAGLTTVIPDGMRAVSVQVNDVIGVAGFVLPGSHVDVIVIGSPEKGGGSDVSKLFLENVQVLAAGTNVQQDANGQPMKVNVVTLLVTPDDAEKLALSTVDSRIQLALRNPLDKDQTNPAAVRKEALYGMPSAPAPAPPRPKTTVVRYRPKAPVRPAVAAAVGPAPAAGRSYTVEVISGTKRETSTFEVKEKSKE
jgi:pilus assembly protein CpaB